MKFDRKVGTAPRVKVAGRTARIGGDLLRTRRLAVGLLVLAAIIAASWIVLPLGTEAHGQRILVSNIGKLDGSTTDAQNAQAFTTGSNPAKYVLSSVQLTLVDVDDSDIKVRIFTTDSDGKPDSELYTLTNPGSFSSNSGNTFTAPERSNLDADTTYAVVVTDEDGTGSLPGIDMRRTTETGEDTTQEGWSIADKSFTRSTSTASWAESTAEMLQIRIRGVINNNPATGRPSIVYGGPPLLPGDTISVSQGNISDQDGMFTANWSLEGSSGAPTYQWVRVDSDGSNATDIDGETSRFYILTDADEGKRIKVKLSFVDDEGHAEGPLVSNATVKVEATAPTIKSVSISSDPGNDDTYGTGDTIEITVHFSENVTVTGAPQMKIDLGGENKTASYSSTNGDEVEFSYTVVLGDSDDDGISIPANSISIVATALNVTGATIKDNAGIDAVITHNAVAADSGHKVSGAGGL